MPQTDLPGRGPAFLIAGAGPGTQRRAVRFHASAVRLTQKRSPVIAYVGAAAGDSLAFEKMISLLVFGPATKVLPVRLKRRAHSTSSARSILADADLVFFTGGDVEQGMRLIEDRDLAGYLRELSVAGKPMEGLSAGAILLGRHWVRFLDGGEGRAEPFECLGIVPHSFDTHAEGDGWEELLALARVLPAHAHPPDETVIYGIPSGGCAYWDGQALSALGEALVRVRCGATPRLLSPLEVEAIRPA